MYTPKRFILAFFVTLLMLSGLRGVSQSFSYVYIQGDRQTPFYVKLEGEMLPRYSKNYYIIPQLAPGPIHLQILFQQNEFPVQNFTVQVPENGFRGFLLTRKGNDFALYDIHQRFYLAPGDAGEDHLPEMVTPAVRPVASRPATTKKTPVAAKKTPVKTATKPAEPKVPETGDDQPAFIGDIELSNEHSGSGQRDNVPDYNDEPAKISKQPETNNNTKEQEAYNIQSEPAVEEQLDNAPPKEEKQPESEPVLNTSRSGPAIINSDCPDPIGEASFDDLFNKVQQKDRDDKKIGLLLSKTKNTCFSCHQVFLLARQMEAESLRYTFLKKVYPRITDQHNFPLLEELFKTLEWKSYFKLIQ
jgi:hypothetical protein